jgi:DNA-binding transcriptional LysR family regulator
MDLRDLECFVTVADEGSISRAATRLHMTQPPLTVRLKALERELGVELLVRHGRGVELTAAGRLLAERTRKMLTELRATSDMVRAVGLGTRGRLTVAVGRTVSPRLLPDLTRAVALGQDIDLTLVDTSDADVVERVRHRDAHAGLLHLPPAEPGRRHRSHGLEVAVVTREPLVVVLPPDHKAGTEDRVDLATVDDDYVTLGSEVSEGFNAHVHHAWTAARTQSTARHEAGSIAHALALVEAGVGVTLLPVDHVSLVCDRLVVRPLKQHTTVVETAVCWRADEDSPVLRRFLRTALSTPEPDVLSPEHARRPPVA